MTKGVRIRDVDHGYKDLFRRVFVDEPKVRVEVGIFAEEGAKEYVPKAERGGAPAAPLTVLQIGVFHEFGLGVPERSFIRAYFDANGEHLRKLAKALMVSVVQGKRTRDQIVNIIGLRMVGEIQARISAGIEPALAQSTIDRKGSSTPLVDTGQLRSSISYRVR